jgi:hypothetical protein
MKEPSTEEIADQVAALRSIKPRVLHKSAFNEDHHAAIDAQIQVLVEGLNDRQIEGRFGRSPSNIYDAVQEARSWLDGKELEGGGSDLTEQWKELVR